jgi:hypothetical protein
VILSVKSRKSKVSGRGLLLLSPRPFLDHSGGRLKPTNPVRVGGAGATEGKPQRLQASGRPVERLSALWPEA